MTSRALNLAAVALLIGFFSAKPAQTQAQNLEAGKSPSQIFAGTCTACHKSPRGLLRTVSPGSLPSFLREHYTTSSEMASLLSGFLVSNGATDTRYAQPKPGKDGKSEPRPAAPPDQLDRFGRRLRPPAAIPEAVRPDAEPREAARPDADGIAPHGRKRLARPGEAPGADGVANDRGPDGRKLSAKQSLSKRGRPSTEEPPKADEAAKTDAAKTDAPKDEPAKGEVAKDDMPKGEPAKDEASKPEGAKPPGEGRSESAGIAPPKQTGGGETPVLRADPVPPVTPAPPAPPAVSAAASGGTSEPPVTPPAPPPEPPAMTASAPPPPPIAPAGPPAPPISQ
jgi:hypothetical protein